MRFGKSWDEVIEEPATSGEYMKYFKDGDTTFRIIQEPSDWVGYWEHFNPGGYPFPCTQERDTCPGCTSTNEKMKKASRKIAINVLQGEYINVYKIPKTVADKLANRAERIGTITDRDYTISRIVSNNADGSKKYDYDIEGQDKIPVDIDKLELKDVEVMLAEAFNQAWGDPDKALQSKAVAEEKQSESDLKSRIQRSEKKEEPAPFEATPPKVWTEDELRALRLDEIIKVCLQEGVGEPPADAKTTDAVVDWLLEQQ